MQRSYPSFNDQIYLHPSRLRVLEGRYEPPRVRSKADSEVFTRRIDRLHHGLHSWMHDREIPRQLILFETGNARRWQKTSLLQISKGTNMQEFWIYRLHITFQVAIRHHLRGLCHRPQVLGYKGNQRLVESPACREIANETPRANEPGPGAVRNQPHFRFRGRI